MNSSGAAVGTAVAVGVGLGAVVLAGMGVSVGAVVAVSDGVADAVVSRKLAVGDCNGKGLGVNGLFKQEGTRAVPESAARILRN